MQRAIEAGTRTRTGEPGPNYWQQHVDYDIQTELVPEELTVRGSETITYENRSPDTLGELWLNLAQNVYAPGNPRDRPVPITGGFSLDRVVVQGTTMEVDQPRAGPSLGTVVGLSLPDSLASGGTVTVQIDWHFKVPEGTFRGGREGDDVFYISQWYPQIATYDDLQGWVKDPYLGDGEFYLEYGDFHVAITAPAGWLVSASGVLQNPEEVLTPAALARLQTRSRDSITAVVTREDRDAGRLTASGGADGKLTWRWEADNVRDFAWGASDRYVWDATVAEYEDQSGDVHTSDINVFYRPEQPNWDRAAEFARHAIETHSWWYPYPYPQMTVNEGVIGGGMEYPMITIIGGGRTPESLYGTVSHELAHMWWPMVVGSNERRYAWMDEGLASFAEDIATPQIFPDVGDAGLGSMRGYLRIAGSDRETESMRAADLYGPFGNRGIASYSKPASVFRMLREVLTPAVFDRAMRTYVRRWAFKHPHPLDLFWTFEDVSGQDLDWFFQPWLYTTEVLDQAVVDVQDREGESVAILENHGQMKMPVILQVRSTDGETKEIRRSWDAWGDDGLMVVPLPVEGAVSEVVLDPDQKFPDVDRSNNRWPVGG
jgi:hypothetical protein